MKSRASIENDITRIRDEIARVTHRDALVKILTRHDFKGLPEAAKKELQDAVNQRWKAVQ
jgi:hypothetical protein